MSIRHPVMIMRLAQAHRLPGSLFPRLIPSPICREIPFVLIGAGCGLVP